MDNVDETSNYEELVVENPVDKDKKTIYLKISDDENIIESNLIEIPFISLERKRTLITKVEYDWVDSVGNKKGIVIKGSVDYGCPTIYELDVLMALFRIYVKDNNIVYDTELQKYSMPRKIHFSFSELAKEMGYKSFSSVVKKRIEKALKILLETSLYSTGAGSLYDAETGDYITDEERERGYHILEEYESYSYKKASRKGQKRVRAQEVKQNISIKFNSFFYNSLCNSYFKIIDYDKYKSLRSGISKRIYLLLEKWSKQGHKKVLKYDTLYNRIPMDRTKENKYNKRLLKKGLNELKDIGYLNDFKMTKENVEFIFKENKNENILQKQKDEKYYGLDKYLNLSEVLAYLNQYDFDLYSATECLGSNSLEYIKALFRYCDNMQKIEKIKDVHSWLLKGLTKEPYNIPDEFYNKKS